MSDQQVFEYVVLLHPTEKEKKDGVKTKMIVDVKRLVAADAGTATLLAARAIPTEFEESIERVQVVVRPF